MTHRSIDPQGPRSDFDLIRILSHQLGMLGLGTPIKLRTPKRHSMKSASMSPATIFRTRACLRADRNCATATCKTLESSYDVACRNSFFFDTIICLRAALWAVTVPELTSTNEAKETPWSSSRRHQHPVLVVSLVKIAVLLFVVMTALAYLTWFERKVVAHIQSRWGPYYVGAHGLLQPLADGVKFLFKEDMTPPTCGQVRLFPRAVSGACARAHGHRADSLRAADRSLLGQPIFIVSQTSISACCFLFAITSMGVYGVALAGWSSNSKYPLLGGLRSSAQMISYEVSLTLSVVGVLLLAGTLELQRNHQRAKRRSGTGTLFRAGTLIPQIVGFLCYIIAAIAETNRIPFDLPEAETELVAGFHTEYSSFKFAMFFMAEYANMITVSCLATILFFGGWLSPFPDSWTWQHYLPGVGLVLLGGVLLRMTPSRTCAASRAFSSASSRCCALAVGALCLHPAGARRDSRAVLVHDEGSVVPVFLRLDARHAASLPL